MFNPFRKKRYVVRHNDAANRLIVERNWFQNLFYPICFATYTETMKASRIEIEIESAELFVKHIREHLKHGEDVVCKICGKSVEDIYIENHNKGA